MFVTRNKLLQFNQTKSVSERRGLVSKIGHLFASPVPYELKYVKQIKLYCSEHHPFPPLAARKVGDE